MTTITGSPGMAPVVRKVLAGTALLGIVVVAASLLVPIAGVTAGVAAGVAVVWLNLFGLAWLLGRFIASRDRGAGGGIYLALYILKFFAIIGVVFLLITSGRINPIAFAVGVSVLLAALLAVVLVKGLDTLGGN